MRTIIDIKVIVFLISCHLAGNVSAQENVYSLEQAAEIALTNNPAIKAASSETEARRELLKTNFDLPKTEVSLQYGQYNGYPRNDNNFVITQQIPFFSLGSQAKLNRALVGSSQLHESVTRNDLVLQVKQTWMQLSYLHSLRQLLLQQDSIFEGFYRAAALRYKTGETNLLERSTAEAQLGEIKNRVKLNEADIAVMQSQLQALLNTPAVPDINPKALRELPMNALPDTSVMAANPVLAFTRQQMEVAKAERKLQGAKFMPDLTVGYFNQTLIGVENPETGGLATSADRFMGFQVGLALPLWFGSHQGRLNATKFRQRASEQTFNSSRLKLNAELEQALQTYQANRNSLQYYKSTALPNADNILKQSDVSYRKGEIGYAEYLLGLRNATMVKESYLRTLNTYNQSIIFIEFLSGNKLN